MILMKHIRLFLNNGCVKLDLEAVKHRQILFQHRFSHLSFVLSDIIHTFAEILKREQMTNKTHKDNPKFYSGYMSEVEALFSILRDYNLVI